MIVSICPYARRLQEAVAVLKGEVENTEGVLKGKVSKADSEMLPVDFAFQLLDTAFAFYQHSFDEKYGGFGNAPKFPTPHNLLFMMQY